MGMLEWAKKEVELACKKENPNWDGKSFDYGCACYQSALKAYESLIEDDHSGFSWGLTKGILVRLMDGNVLTPIEDTDDIWAAESISEKMDIKQCKRMSSLFKVINKDGSVIYTDHNRVYCMYDGSDATFTTGRATRCVDALFPITMPYMPNTHKYKVMFHTDDDDHPYAIVTPDGITYEVGYNGSEYYKKEANKSNEEVISEPEN